MGVLVLVEAYYEQYGEDEAGHMTSFVTNFETVLSASLVNLCSAVLSLLTAIA